MVEQDMDPKAKLLAEAMHLLIAGHVEAHTENTRPLAATLQFLVAEGWDVNFQVSAALERGASYV
jgi:hypothetical protein